MRINIPDTNVFILNPHYITDTLQENADCTILVTSVVLEELNKLKRGEFSRNVNARLSLSDIYKNSKSERVEIKVMKEIDLVEKIHTTSEVADTIFIKEIEEYNESSDNRINVITNDKALLVKLKTLEIDCSEYNKYEVSDNSGYEEIPVVDDISLYPLNEFVIYNNELYFNGKAVDVTQKAGKLGHMNTEQLALIHLLNSDIPVTAVMGRPGSGKSLLTIAHAISNVLEDKNYKSVVYIKDYIGVGRDYGFLPGDEKDKLAGLKESLIDSLEFIFSDAQGEKSDDDFKFNPHGKLTKGESMCHTLELTKSLNFRTPYWVRGRDIKNSIIIVDEAQNMSPLTLKTIITRAASSSKVILCGDVKQIDDVYMTENNNGLIYTISKLKNEDYFGYINLNHSFRNPIHDRIDKKL
ncbi:MAG: PhoH family protein [Paraclostridium sp.]